jgi:hypothetical protein
MEKENRKFASEDILAIEELAEQLASELNVDDDIEQVEDETADAVPIVEDPTPDEVTAAAEELLADAELPDEQKIVGDHDVQDVLKEADELEDEIDKQEAAADADALEKELDACTTAGESCPECGKEPCECNKEASEKVASEMKPGIEDKIGDEANGGDPSVSELPDTKIDCESDKEVFGQNTDSEYVAKITARLDRVAAALEARGMKKMAFRVDQLSDKLEASIR